MHRLLNRQLKKHFGKEYDFDAFEPNLQELFHDIERSYLAYEKDKEFVEHILKLNSEELYESNKKLQYINQNLEDKVKEEVSQNRKKDQQIMQQSRLAQMGEMISMIAHQWRQPLGAISATSINMNLKLQLNEFDLAQEKERVECQILFIDNLKKIDGFVHNLTATIDDFRNFYKPNKETIITLINSPVEKALNIVKATFESEGIEVVKEYTCKNRIKMYENELMQVILNILKNSQDNFKEKNTQNAQIIIKAYDIDNGVGLEISDNGGGIPEKILQKIFDPYFSTKSEKDGTGLGLYMSKTIIETHHNGKLYAQNRDEGVCFFIDMKSDLSTLF